MDQRRTRAPDPPRENLFNNVYVEDHPGLAREREEFFEYQAGFADAGVDAGAAGQGVAR